MEKRYKVVVAGAINNDIICSLNCPPVINTSNPCTSSNNFGGVAFNIARHLARNQKLDIKMMSAVGDDISGRKALAHALDHGIDISFIDKMTNHKTSTYFAFNEPNGYMFIAFNDMGIVDELCFENYRARLDVEKMDALVIDGNLPKTFIKSYCEFALEKKITLRAAVAVSSQKIDRLFEALPFFTHLVLNEKEADELLKSAYQDATEKALKIQELGVKHVIVTLGKRGIAYATPDEAGTVYQDPLENIQDENGAGDAFAAGLLNGLFIGQSFKKSVEDGFFLARKILSVCGTVFSRK